MIPHIDPSEPGSVHADAASDVPAARAAMHARLLEREGIAMVVALDDLRPGRSLRVRDPDALTDGTRLRDLLDHYYTALAAAGFTPAPPGEPDETGSPELIEALATLSNEHLHARTEPPR